METAETAETLTAPATLQILTLFVRYGTNSVVSSSYVLTGSASIESMVWTFEHYDGFELVDFCVDQYALILF